MIQLFTQLVIAIKKLNCFPHKYLLNPFIPIQQQQLQEGKQVNFLVILDFSWCKRDWIKNVVFVHLCENSTATYRCVSCFGRCISDECILMICIGESHDCLRHQLSLKNLKNHSHPSGSDLYPEYFLVSLNSGNEGKTLDVCSKDIKQSDCFYISVGS